MTDKTDGKRGTGRRMYLLLLSLAFAIVAIGMLIPLLAIWLTYINGGFEYYWFYALLGTLLISLMVTAVLVALASAIAAYAKQWLPPEGRDNEK